MANMTFDSSIKNMSIKATDGEIGHCVDLLFDEKHWTARYLVVKTGNWLFGEKVLIPIVSVDGINLEEEQVNVCLSQEEVKNAPNIDSDAPVSRRHEISMMDYYSYGYYWVGGQWGAGLDPMALRSPLDYPEQTIPPKQDGDPDLRSVEEIIGYTIDAADDDVGAIKDVYIDSSDWSISYMIVKTGGWLSRKDVLLSPEWINSVSWTTKSLGTDLTTSRIGEAPEFDKPLDDEFEQRLRAHYMRAKAS